jgi:hypothetical protein
LQVVPVFDLAGDLQWQVLGFPVGGGFFARRAGWDDLTTLLSIQFVAGMKAELMMGAVCVNATFAMQIGSNKKLLDTQHNGLVRNGGANCQGWEQPFMWSALCPWMYKALAYLSEAGP